MTIPCEHMELRLTAYVDGVAKPDEGREVEDHLRHCAACRESVAVQRAVRQLVAARGRAAAIPAPPGLRGRIARTLGAEQPAGLAPGWRLRLSAFAAAALVVLALGAVALPVLTGGSTIVLAAQLALDHLKCFLIERHDDAAALSVDDAEAELKDDYGWDLRVPSTAGAPDGKLVAARRCLYGQGRAAHLLYTVDGQPVSLFILPGVERPPVRVSVLGQEEVSWSQHGQTYLLVGAAGLGHRLQEMASNLRDGAE